ncbi:MAG: DNA-directed RNA polymerase subunit delta [Clostridia bacterium]|nr:DNA-directed RNA polymerase subunit delta [Clostridia bacterium]
MELANQLKPSMSIGDITYHVLKAQGKPLHYRDIVKKVLEIKPLPGLDDGRQVARVLTELNLDNRFIHLGGGDWNLREKISLRAIKQYEDEWEN